MTIADVLHVIDNFAPFEAQAEFDHSGLQVGDPSSACTGVLVAVDLTDGVIEEALRTGCNLIVTHHPAIWSPLAEVRRDSVTGALVYALIEHDLHYAAAHTNVDNCVDGNSERLIRLLGGEPTGHLEEDAYAVTFSLPPIRLSALAAEVRDALQDPTVCYVGEDDVLTAGALCTGAGADDATIAACMRRGLVYLTAEVKHHQFRYVEAAHGHLIVFGHFTSEKIFVTIIREVLEAASVRVVASEQTSPCVCVGEGV